MASRGGKLLLVHRLEKAAVDVYGRQCATKKGAGEGKKTFLRSIRHRLLHRATVAQEASLKLGGQSEAWLLVDRHHPEERGALSPGVGSLQYK